MDPRLTPDEKYPEIPKLPGFLQNKDTKREVIRVWCSHCCIWHTHGSATDDPERGAGHRRPHCGDRQSPYAETGYTIVTSDKMFEEVKKTMKTATTNQRWVIRDGRITSAIEQLRRQTPPAL